MADKDTEQRYLSIKELEEVSGGEMGDGKFGGDGGFDGYFSFKCPRCGGNHWYVVDYLPARTWKDGTPRASAGLFECMDCGFYDEFDDVDIY